ncbi:MAG: hypothetical protein JWM80_279 [Cyanobacteria bacterium RYN_339]|nr:hypothetical protein [Cyanobacteria bacterium RYN_339]
MSKLAIVQERRRLTAEYLAWARGNNLAAVKRAKLDLARHEREAAKLVRKLEYLRTTTPWQRLRGVIYDTVPVVVFVLAASLFTWLGRWDAGLVGLMNGLGAALAYLYFAKDTGRLRL